MARKVSPFKLGLFILICGALGLVAVIWLGASHHFEERKTYVTYFDESVKGLQKDAVVNYRGVAVGRATAIRLAPDGRLIEVRMDLQPHFHVDESLAILLREQGLTGMRYLEIDEAPPDLAQLTPQVNFQLQYPLIPSYPSEIEQLKTALENIYAKISSLDLNRLTSTWTETGERINAVLATLSTAINPQEWQAVADAAKKTAQESATFMGRLNAATPEKDLKKAFSDLASTLAASRESTESLSRQLRALPPDTLTKMAGRWNSALTSGDDVLASADQRINESAVLLQQSLQQIQVLLTQINTLVQTLREQPNRLIFSPKSPDPFERK